MIVVSTRGCPIDTSAPVWRLSAEHSVRLDLPAPPGMAAGEWEGWLGALRDYLRECIRTVAPITVLTRHSNAVAIMRNPAAMDALRRGGPRVVGAMYDALRGAAPGLGGDPTGLAPASAARYLANWRMFYLFCCDQSDVADVNLETAFAMRGVVLHARAGSPGRAVLRADPVDGPLPEGLARRLDRAVVTMAHDRRIDLATAVAALLMLRLGCNAENLRRLEESDYRPPRAGGPPSLAVPRIKKKVGAGRRDDFKVRDIDPELGGLIGELIAENRRRAQPVPGADRLRGRPLFRRSTPAAHLLGTVHEEGACRVTKNFFLHALARVSEALPATLQVGRLTPRRMRYTFATRMVMRGVPPIVLMELLDHSDLSNVMVYFNASLGVVQSLDRTVGPTIALIVAVMEGRAPVRSLEGLPGVRPPDRSASLAAPRACLNCAAFRPCSAPALLALADRLDVPLSGDRVDGDRALAATARIAASLLEGRRPAPTVPEPAGARR